MKKLAIRKSLVMLSIGAMCLGGCTVETYGPPGVVASAELDVPGPPPAPLVDVETASPGPDFVWIGGAWNWVGGRWTWDAGRWEHRPHPGAVWVPHHYAYRNGRHVFTRGHWK